MIAAWVCCMFVPHLLLVLQGEARTPSATAPTAPAMLSPQRYTSSWVGHRCLPSLHCTHKGVQGVQYMCRLLYSLYSCSNPEECNINLLGTGDSRQVDVASVHYGDQLQNVATTMASYGYFGDLLRTSERWRKLGPTRYLLSGVLQLFRNRFYEGQLEVRAPAAPLAQPYDVNICSDRCSVCTKAAMSPPTPGEWLQVRPRLHRTPTLAILL